MWAFGRNRNLIGCSIPDCVPSNARSLGIITELLTHIKPHQLTLKLIILEYLEDRDIKFEV